MKLIALILVVAVLYGVKGDHQEHPEKVKKIEDECIKETGVDPNLIAKAEKGQFEDGNDLKCFPKCMFLKMNFMTDKGELNMDGMKEAMKDKPNKDDLIKIAEKCTEKGKDACETAYLAYRCFLEAVNKKP